MHDLLIRGATVVDGSGGEPFVADVAVDGGIISAIGRTDGAAREVLDADGAHLLPGFIDIHTHFDGQATWDETFTPSIYHGITTVVMGNCGVGFAPVRRGQESVLIDLMEGVEEIPGSVLSEGMRWGWESFAEYCRQLDAMPHSMDFMTLVPHDALRLYVMGERASNGEAATADDIHAMQGLLREVLLDGAAGFSVGSTETHRTARGRMTPGFSVHGDELVGLASVLRDLPYRVLQAVDDFAATRGNPVEERSRFDREYGKIEAMARAAERPLALSWLDRVFAPMQRCWLGDAARESAAQGVDIRLACAPRGSGVLSGLDTTMNLLLAYPAYREIMHLPCAERAARMRDPAVKARILAQAPEKLAVAGSFFPPVLDFVIANFEALAMTMFPFVEGPGGIDYEPDPVRSIGAHARARGVTAKEAMYDFLAEGDGSNLIYYPIYNYAGGNLNIVREMLTHPQALHALADAGAHQGTICDASYATTLLTHWVQHRSRGERLPLPWVVELLTRRNARFLGLQDRGEIAVGKRADLNVVDLAALHLPKPEIVRDLPAGGRRIVQRASGYRATYVAGQAITRNGEITSARPGRWLRAAGHA